MINKKNNGIGKQNTFIDKHQVKPEGQLTKFFKKSQTNLPEMNSEDVMIVLFVIYFR